MKTVVIVTALLAATPAFAQSTIEVVPTCVVIDGEHDELPEAERPNARALLVRALERLDQLIVETGCQETITLSHQRIDRSVHVRLASSVARRKLTVSIEDDMLDVYERMAKSLLEAMKPAPPAPPAPVSSEAPAPSAAPADLEEPIAGAARTTPHTMPVDTYAAEDGEVAAHQRLWYLRGGLAVLDGTSAVAFATGWRRGSRALTYDLSFAFISGEDRGTTVSNVSARFQVLRYVHPEKRSSTYFGGGGSLGYFSSSPMEEGVSGGGAQLDGTLGYEWNRTGERRFSIEGSLMLPLYTIGERYPAAFVTSFGIGM